MFRRALELFAICVLVAPVSAPAQEPSTGDATAATQGVLIEGSESAAWTDLQASGIAASPHAQTLSGDVMDKTYKRYVESFAAPIPVRFPKDSNSISGGGQ